MLGRQVSNLLLSIIRYAIELGKGGIDVSLFEWQSKELNKGGKEGKLVS